MSAQDFSILSKIGDGAYSCVYKVKRLLDNKIYALKKVKLNNLKEKQLDNALNQVRILASIQHPNIIAYKEAFLQGKSLCIIMEFAENGDLQQKITKQHGRLFDEVEIWKMLILSAKGLNRLHSMNIFHRDIKSANFFLGKDGQPKLGDLNVSKVAHNGLLFTQTGTPYYASPQVWLNQPYDSKSDIWSFGCVIYQMTTLQVPFRAQDMESLCKAVTQGSYTSIPCFYSTELSNVIKMMLSIDSNKRPSTKKLLRSSLFQHKAAELGINLSDSNNQNFMLKTIHIPKNLHYLTGSLPKSKYQLYKDKSACGLQRVNNDRLNNVFPILEGIICHHENKIDRDKYYRGHYPKYSNLKTISIKPKKYDTFKVVENKETLKNDRKGIKISKPKILGILPPIQK